MTATNPDGMPARADRQGGWTEGSKHANLATSSHGSPLAGQKVCADPERPTQVLQLKYCEMCLKSTQGLLVMSQMSHDVFCDSNYFFGHRAWIAVLLGSGTIFLVPGVCMASSTGCQRQFSYISPTKFRLQALNLQVSRRDDYTLLIC